MLYWAAAFFVVACVAGFFGLGSAGTAASGVAWSLFFVFLVIFLFALVAGLTMRGTELGGSFCRGPPPPVPPRLRVRGRNGSKPKKRGSSAQKPRASKRARKEQSR